MALTDELARRIDRLARRAHAFHRFAHHPLCDRYAGELITLRGRRRVCRGCSYALAGATAGLLSATAFTLPALPFALASAATLAWVGYALHNMASRAAGSSFALEVGAMSMSMSTRRAPSHLSASLPLRASKAWTRALPAFVCSAAVAACLRTGNASQVCVALVLALTMTLCLRSYRRRGPDRSACWQCPEYTGAGPCSGYREIVRAERAFVRRAAQLIDGAHKVGLNS